MEHKNPSSLLSPSALNAATNQNPSASNANANSATANQKMPLSGPSLMMGAAHGNAGG